MKKLRTSAKANSILQSAINDLSIEYVGSYTVPRTWGVYQLKPQQNTLTKRIFRIGNHPVRKNELERDFGAVDVIALFTSRYLANELAVALNEKSP